MIHNPGIVTCIYNPCMKESQEDIKLKYPDSVLNNKMAEDCSIIVISWFF